MKILEHPLAEQIGAETDPKGSLFSPILRLKGEYSLAAIRSLLGSEFMPAIKDDLVNGEYRMITFLPDQINFKEADDDRFFADSVISQRFGGKDNFYLNERNASGYGPASPHTHPGRICTSTLCIEDGTLPTMFVPDESEFMDILYRNKSDMGDLGPEIDRISENQNGVAEAASNLLTATYEASSQSTKARIGAFLTILKAKLTSKILRKPKLGTINVFASNVLHASDETAHMGMGEAGTLFTQSWK